MGKLDEDFSLLEEPVVGHLMTKVKAEQEAKK